MITSKPLQRHGARSWPGCQGREWWPLLEAPPLLVLPPQRYRNKECLRLHPPDFSNWSLPFPEAPLTGGLSTPSGGLPSIGRQTAGPRASGQKALAPPTQVLSTPQGTLPVCQPRSHQPATPYQQAAQPQSQPATPYEQAVQPLSQPATPYQQAVQPPRRSTGRGLLARPTSDGAAPAPDQTIPDCGRQQARGRGIRGRSASHPGRDRGMTTNAPSTTTQGNAQSQPGHHSRPGCPGPTEMAAKYRSSGW